MNTLSIEEREALKDAVSKLMADASNETAVRETMETSSGFDAGLWRQLAEMGVTGLIIEEKFGGSGVGPVELEAVMEEAGAALLCAPLLASSVIAASLLQQLGDVTVCENLLPRMASGDCIASVVLTGDAGNWTPEGVSVEATEAADGWQLSGRGSYVLHAQNADILIVIAKTAADFAAFTVDSKAAGLSIEALPTFDKTLRLASVDLEAVTASRIDAVNPVWDAVKHTLDMALVALAGEQAGGANKVLEFTVEYAKTRVQFGRQIGSYQAIKHMAADLLVETESALSAARYAAACLAENSDKSDEAVSLAAFACADAYVKAAADGIQMHGGIAFTWEHPAHLYLRRARSGAQLFGDSDYHRENYLQALGG